MGQGILASGENELGFMIEGVFKYKFFGSTVWFTTSNICLIIVVLLLCIFSIVAGHCIKKETDEPNGFQCFIELIVEKLDGMIGNTMNPGGYKAYRNYIGTIFCFILISNISGLLGLRPPTADYGVTLPLGIITFTLIHYNQFKYNKPSTIWRDMTSPLPPWLPIWFPINLISEIAVPISLSLRLFANVLSGTIMMALVYGLLKFIAIGWPAVLHVYFDLFSGAIQTYVFCMLTMTYITNQRGDN